jgi:hypothetical protein
MRDRIMGFFIFSVFAGKTENGFGKKNYLLTFDQ